MEQQKQLTKEQAFALVDRVCSNVQLTRADNASVIAALQLIAKELSDKPVEPVKKEIDKKV